MSDPSNLLRRWEHSLPQRVSVAGAFARNPVAYKWKAPYRSLVLRETLFWRTYDLLRQAQLLHDEHHTLGSRILLRSALESVAVLSHLNQVTARLLEGSIKFDTFDGKTRKLLLGSRNRSTKHQSINVVTILEQVEMTYPGVLHLYGILSESTHPNYEGVCFGYSDIDHEKAETSFRIKLHEMWGDCYDSLFMFVATFFEYEYNDIWVPQIERLEAWLADHDHELQDSIGGNA